MDRFTRPVAFQGTAEGALPPALQTGNPWAVPRRINGRLRPATTDAAGSTQTQAPTTPQAQTGWS